MKRIDHADASSKVIRAKDHVEFHDRRLWDLRRRRHRESEHLAEWEELRSLASAIGLECERLESLLATHPEIVYRVMRAIVRTVHEIQRRISMQSAELTNYIYKQHGKY